MDWSYLAGFVDGEGYIGIARARRFNGVSYGVHLDIGNTNKNIVKEIQKFIGIKRKIKEYDRPTKFYRIYYTGDSCRAVLGNLLPYLIVKKQQAEIVSNFPKRKHNNQFGKVNNFYIEFEQEKLYRKCRELNSNTKSNDNQSILFSNAGNSNR